MARTKLKFRLHRAVIVLFCLALLVALMQGASWFSQNHQRQRNPQLEELARTLARQVTLNVAPLMRTDSPDEKRIQAILDQLTDESRILDAGVYDEQGDLIARSAKASKCATGWRSTVKKQAAILTSRLSSQLRVKTDRSAICA
ncbi:putative membrane protein affecting hemolysin expression [Shigella sonnei]|nr:putative membrane protein affecting hemolysin expression [Shigella sonnei]